ncbi:DNA-binding protein [Kribbella amoyensis]|uniref:DNA-binding protein n=1 Tax=Kribbella amoyensis TaxID=996641 RepID=UPI0011A40A27|nr:DNA-binding protein [Kribbella amoyensis]
MTTRGGRTEDCNRAQASVRLSQARAFLDVAQLVGAEDDELANDNVAAALAVLAGIAAADAACCASLGRRSRGQDHRQAIQLLAQAGSEGKAMSRALVRLLDVKDNAHYGMVYVGPQQARNAIRSATTLVDGAARLLAP